MSELELKVDLIQQTMEAITHVRDLVSKLSSEEKQSLASAFPPYRQLIQSCRNKEIDRLEQTIREHARVIANSFAAIDVFEGMLVESHDLILRLITTFVSDQDGAYQQACDLMRKIRDTCPDKEFPGGQAPNPPEPQ